MRAGRSDCDFTPEIEVLCTLFGRYVPLEKDLANLLQNNPFRISGEFFGGARLKRGTILSKTAKKVDQIQSTFFNNGAPLKNWPQPNVNKHVRFCLFQ